MVDAALVQGKIFQAPALDTLIMTRMAKAIHHTLAALSLLASQADCAGVNHDLTPPLPDLHNHTATIITLYNKCPQLPSVHTPLRCANY